MDIEITDFAPAAKRIRLIGKLDIDGARKIETPLTEVAGGQRSVVVDMGQVTFISSIGIRHLVTAAKTLSRKAGRLVLLGPSPMVAEVLKVSGLDTILSIVRTDEEAMAAIGTARG